jgi:hypothetical protein
MESTVTMSLAEVERLKKEIESLETKVSKLKSIKQPTSFLTLQYDFRRDASFEWNVVDGIKVDELTEKLDTIVKRNFNDIFKESKELKFYNKFPKFIHKLFDAN